MRGFLDGGVPVADGSSAEVERVGLRDEEARTRGGVTTATPTPPFDTLFTIIPDAFGVPFLPSSPASECFCSEDDGSGLEGAREGNDIDRTADTDADVLPTCTLMEPDVVARRMPDTDAAAATGAVLWVDIEMEDTRACGRVGRPLLLAGLESLGMLVVAMVDDENNVPVPDPCVIC